MTVVTALAAGTSLFGWLNVLLYIAWLVLLTLYLLVNSCELTDPGGRRVDVVGTGGRRGVLAGAVVLAALDSGSAYGVLTAAALAGLAWAVGALPRRHPVRDYT